MITLDSSGIIALLRRADAHHLQAVNTVTSDRGPLIVPAGILSEVTYMLEAHAGHSVSDSFVASLEDGSIQFDCGERDFARIRKLVDRYKDLPLGFADASVIACAERRGGRVLTYDQRHFPIVAREGTITITSDT